MMVCLGYHYEKYALICKLLNYQVKKTRTSRHWLKVMGNFCLNIKDDCPKPILTEEEISV